MIRKTFLAVAAVAALGAAALAPTSASAWGIKGGWHGHHHHHWHGGLGFYGVNYVGPDCYWVKRYNKFGQPRLVKVCSY
jgi:hypothetical protein